MRRVVVKTKTSKVSRRSFITLPLSLILILVTVTLIPHTYGGDRKPVKPSPKDKCPVCGMFVAKYPDFLAEIIFKNGSTFFFDGTKDMFKYYFNLKKYNPSEKLENIDSIYVTDYYNLNLIDGIKAYYVTGSDVYGPMGKELISFGNEGDSHGFMKDHKGKSLLRLKEITFETVRGLD
jgi:copper chaperone NosL